MSKLVKQLVSNHLRKRLDGVENALLVNVIGLNSLATSKLRNELAKKNIQLTVVKNSIAQCAVADTPLAAAFEGAQGSLAIVWGSEDIVSLAKEVIRLTEIKDFAKFEAKGGVLDGAGLSAAEAKAVSKWPSRREQLSILVGQILSPGATLAAQLLGPGGKLASQIKQRIEDLEKNNPAPAESAPAAEQPV